jgi:hypothetical protein
VLLRWKLNRSRPDLVMLYLVMSRSHIFFQAPANRLQLTRYSYLAPNPWLQLYNNVNVMNFAPIWINFYKATSYLSREWIWREKKNNQIREKILMRLWWLRPFYNTVESFQVEHQSHCGSHQNRAPQPSKHRASEQAKDRAQKPSQDWAPGPKMLFIAALALKHDHKNHY